MKTIDQLIVIVCILILFVCAKCNTTPAIDTKIPATNKYDSAVVSNIESNMIYYKSIATGNCYAVTKSANGGSYNNYTPVCVPCDSLKHVKVYVIDIASNR
jgi:hypothetical protein